MNSLMSGYGLTTTYFMVEGFYHQIVEGFCINLHRPSLSQKVRWEADCNTFTLHK